MKKWILPAYLLGLFCVSLVVTGMLLSSPDKGYVYRWTPEPIPLPPISNEINYKAMLETPKASPAHPDWTPGPLANISLKLADKLGPQLETGDILFRSSDAVAADGTPFSSYVERFTESDFSHASIILRDGNDIYVLEIDDLGVHLYTLADWLVTPSDPDFAVYKPRNSTPSLIDCMKQEIDRFLIEKPPYDFLFNDPNKYYCVEAVAEVYLRCGIKLCEPKTVREVLSPLAFRFFVPINQRMIEEEGQGMPLDEPLWFVGNEEHGLMSSEHLYKFYRHKEHV